MDTLTTISLIAAAVGLTALGYFRLKRPRKQPFNYGTDRGARTDSLLVQFHDGGVSNP